PTCAAPTPACSGGACLACIPGAQRCNGTNIERCDGTGSWQTLTTCGANGCLDPGGGNPASLAQVCGKCPANARRCSGGNIQACVAGDWQDMQTCTGFGCYDPDDESGPSGYCGICKNGDRRCNGSGNLESCVNGQWQANNPTCQSGGGSCFDPAPAGG